VKRFKRKDLIAVVLGAVLATAPLVAFDFWLNNLIARQGQEEVNLSAKRALALAEGRLARAVSALDDLAARGIDTCADGHFYAMREAVFAATPVKEIAVVGRDGATQCTSDNIPLGERKVLASEALPGVKDYMLDVMQIGDKGAIRIRRPVGSDGIGLAALLPAELFVPQVSNAGTAFTAFASVVTAGGTPVAQSGKLADSDSQNPPFMAKMHSERFGLAATVVLPRSQVVSNFADLSNLSLFVPASIALIIAAFAYLIPKRQAGNPVVELQKALEAGEFVPYYQPIVDIRSGQLRGAEVLARWRKSDGTLVLPGSFIPLMESSGMIRDLTRDLMRRVCAEAGAAIGKRPALKVSFNFAAQLFTNDSIVREVRSIFAPSPIDLSQVVIELTERDPIENLTETRRIIAALQGMGVRIAIDDVGTGHSGLSYMLKLGVDIIKIDKMFVDSIGTDRNSTTIVETLVDLAHNMRMDIVAEGVENFEQVVHLRELGIRAAQGYVFAPPLPGSAFLQLVEAIDPLGGAARDIADEGDDIVPHVVDAA
jgi:sensor c-di-GMP phosphodiesterase-like protein